MENEPKRFIEEDLKRILKEYPEALGIPNIKYVGEEILIGTTKYPIDMLFNDGRDIYVELKVGNLTHRDVGQLMFYKNAIPKDAILIVVCPKIMNNDVIMTLNMLNVGIRTYDDNIIKEAQIRVSNILHAEAIRKKFITEMIKTLEEEGLDDIRAAVEEAAMEGIRRASEEICNLWILDSEIGITRSIRDEETFGKVLDILQSDNWQEYIKTKEGEKRGKGQSN